MIRGLVARVWNALGVGKASNVQSVSEATISTDTESTSRNEHGPQGSVTHVTELRAYEVPPTLLRRRDGLVVTREWTE